MFRIFRRRNRHLNLDVETTEFDAFDSKHTETRNRVELRLLDELERAGIQIAGGDDAEDGYGRFEFKDAGSAISAACRAAAVTVDQLVITQRRLDVARSANLRLAERLRNLEGRWLRECEASAAVEKQEQANQAERERLQARNDSLAVALRTMVDVTEGFREEQARQEEDMQLEREAHALHVEGLHMQLSDLARSKANALARAAALRAQRDAALQQLGLATPEDALGSGDERRRAGTRESNANLFSVVEDDLSLRPPLAAYSLSATHVSAAGPTDTMDLAPPMELGKVPNKPAKNGAQVQSTQLLQRQILRMRKELHAEVLKRSELEATLLGTRGSLQKAEKVIANLQAALRFEEARAATQRDQAIKDARQKLSLKDSGPSLAILTESIGDRTVSGRAPSSPVITRSSSVEPDASHLVRARSQSEKLVLRSPEKRGYRSQSSLDNVDDATNPSQGEGRSVNQSCKEMSSTDEAMAVASEAAAKKACSEGSTEFNVRGPKYLNDKVKIPAGKPTAKLVHVDFYGSQGRKDHVMRWKPSFPEQRDHYLFVINIQVPGQPFVNCAMFFAIPMCALPEELKEEVQRDDEGKSAAALLQEMGLADPASEDASADDSDENFAEFKQLLADFVNGSDSFRDGRFKLIPALVEAPWVVRRAVGNRPAIVGRKLRNRYFRGDGYIEVDIDISSSSVATSILALVRDYAKGLIVEIGFLVEAQKAAELPEKLLGAVRFTHVDFANVCKDVPESDETEES